MDYYSPLSSKYCSGSSISLGPGSWSMQFILKNIIGKSNAYPDGSIMLSSVTESQGYMPGGLQRTAMAGALTNPFHRIAESYEFHTWNITSAAQVSQSWKGS